MFHSMAKRGLSSLFGFENTEFYTLPEKRVRYKCGAYITVALADGSLFGGCRRLGCPRRLVPLQVFSSGESFDCAFEAHRACVTAKDLEMAREQRAILDQLRIDFCESCQAADAANEQRLVAPNKEPIDP
tara:strand:- start:968 stop:1357 length:390 start_codon:yes stop_codon:yes gene_type:complete